jgi:uncharacterized protein (TIGR03435 family)
MQWAYVRYANGKPSPRDVAPVPDQPIEGDPSWVRSETFTIDAKPESPQTMEMMRGPMLQALLEDGFNLKIHRGTRQVPIYALVVAKGGPKLDAAKKDSVLLHPISQKVSPRRSGQTNHRLAAHSARTGRAEREHSVKR